MSYATLIRGWCNGRLKSDGFLVARYRLQSSSRATIRGSCIQPGALAAPSKARYRINEARIQIRRGIDLAAQTAAWYDRSSGPSPPPLTRVRLRIMNRREGLTGD